MTSQVEPEDTSGAALPDPDELDDFTLIILDRDGNLVGVEETALPLAHAD